MVKQNAKILNAARAFSQKVPLGSAVKDMAVVDGRPFNGIDNLVETDGGHSARMKKRQ